MDEIPFRWRIGEVWTKWEKLGDAYSDRWTFQFENKQDDDIHLTALLKTADGKRHVQYEIVHAPDHNDMGKVCAKSDALEKKVQDANKMML